MSTTQAVSVALVGDVMLQTGLEELLGGRDAGFREALARLGAADLAVGNLEVPLSRRGSKVLKHSNLRADPERIADVHAMGFDAVSLANNHLMDYGAQALLDTLAACDGAGVRRCGAGATIEEALAPAWLEARGRRLALLSVSCTLPPGCEATETDPGIAPLRVAMSFETDLNLLAEQPGTMPIVHTWTRPEDQEVVCGRVRALAREADAVIVAIHWGVPTYWLSPHQGLLAEYQQPLGHALIDSGATVVLGHHSHSLHGIEVYRGRPICYSVGNFIFERPRAFMEPESVIVHARFEPDGAVRVRLTPLMVDERGLPELATGEAATRVFALLERVSAPFGTRFAREGDEIVVPMDNG
jgi:poly-gamma-glutamate capsule biosynthesis protein CapA/YwtB (metallophosphatase superfamily)